MHRSTAAVAEGIFAALGHRVRFEIVVMLLKGERCVCEIAPAFKQERSVVSRHLAVLEKAGIIRSRKVGRRVFYQIADHRVIALLNPTLKTASKPEQVRPRSASFEARGPQPLVSGSSEC